MNVRSKQAVSMTITCSAYTGSMLALRVDMLRARTDVRYALSLLVKLPTYMTTAMSPHCNRVETIFVSTREHKSPGALQCACNRPISMICKLLCTGALAPIYTQQQLHRAFAQPPRHSSPLSCFSDSRLGRMTVLTTTRPEQGMQT